MDQLANKEKRRPRVSVGMPVYNGEQFIREALDSLLAQTFTDFELIVSDNASTDRTEAICEEYVLREPRIRFVRQEKNLGALPNFQICLDLAVGEYFIWAAADDSCKPNLIEALVAELDADKNFVLVMPDVGIVAVDGTPLYRAEFENIRVEDGKNSWDSVWPVFFQNPTAGMFYGIFGLFRTDVLRKVSLNSQNLVRFTWGWESPVIAQVASLGKVGSIPYDLKIFRRHDDSVSADEHKGMTFRQRIDNHFNTSACLFKIAIHSDMNRSAKVRALLALARIRPKFLVKLFLLHPFRAWMQRMSDSRVANTAE